MTDRPPVSSKQAPKYSTARTAAHLIYFGCHQLSASSLCQPLNKLIVNPRLRRSKFGRRACSVAGPMTCNSLPDNLGDPTLSDDKFRVAPKHFFLQVSEHVAHWRHPCVIALYKCTTTHYLLTLVDFRYLHLSFSRLSIMLDAPLLQTIKKTRAEATTLG